MNNIILSFLSYFKEKTPQTVKWEEVREQILNTIEAERDGLAIIEPFEYCDILTGQKLDIRVTPFYSKISVNNREYYFERETCKFDGTAYLPNNH